ARLPNPHRKARPTSYLQQGRLSLRRMEEAARSVSHFRSHFRTHFRTTSLTSYLQPSCLRSEPKEAAVPLANPHQPSHPTVHLPQHCAQSEPTGEGVRHLAPRPTMNSTLNPTAQLSPSCRRSAPMEEAVQRASHPYWAPS